MYSGGTGSSSVSFSNCASVRYFESYTDGGLIFIANPTTTLSSFNSCFEHLYAARLGAMIQGSYIGSFSSSCT